MEQGTAFTEVLAAHARGEEGAFGKLVSMVYEDLRRMAHFKLQGRPRQTLDTKALVHETFLKIAAREDPHWRDRGHFRASFAQAMRHILVDAARNRLSGKRGKGQADATLTEALVGEQRHAEDVLAVDQALGRLRHLDDRISRVVECRFFAGMTEPETAECLGVSARTVHRDWLRARGWLRQYLDAGPKAGGADGKAPGLDRP
ncbi:MAG: sigma-70 family RNA polymerase sigma factor [Deltaproteobacteria bacterium]|nr:sigma-70 family RNA polymerase sigma factor [Deltaproteobacteria bacterium]